MSFTYRTSKPSRMLRTIITTRKYPRQGRRHRELRQLLKWMGEIKNRIAWNKKRRNK